ncbi:MAG: hypothetical protein JXA33_21435 [Anaerolineae bacterium]|nr:hypothetical protein [Anaerolineae bacterium]
MVKEDNTKKINLWLCVILMLVANFLSSLFLFPLPGQASSPHNMPIVISSTITLPISLTITPQLSPTLTVTNTPSPSPTPTFTNTPLPSPTPTWEPIPGIYVIFDFEDGPQGWGGTGLWHLTNHRAGPTTPEQSWWYGQEVSNTYETGSVTSGALTSPIIALIPGTVPLLFVSTWWEVESLNVQEQDLMLLQVSDNYGADWFTLATNNPISKPVDGALGTPYTSGGVNQPGVWTGLGPLDLSTYVGKNIQLRFLFDSVTSEENSFEGWYIDDVYIHSRSMPPPTPTWTPSPTVEPPTATPLPPKLPPPPTATVLPPTSLPTPTLPVPLVLLPETGMDFYSAIPLLVVLSGLFYCLVNFSRRKS